MVHSHGFSMKKFALFLFFLLIPLSASTVSAQSAQVKIYTTRDGLAGNVITAVAFEPNGSAWIGTSEGATHISNAGWVSYTKTHGLGDSFITAIAVAPDGRIWFGTQSGGLSVLNPQTKTFETYALDNSHIPSNFVTALAIDTKNQVWVGTLNNGLARYDATSNIWTHAEFPQNEITVIALNGEDVPWVGTPFGLYALNDEAWVKDAKYSDQSIRRIDVFDGKWFLTTDDSYGILQSTTDAAEEGPTEITNALEQTNLSPLQVTAFGKDEQQRYWLGTAQGLFMVHRGNAPTPPPPLPVVLIHGWTVAPPDTLETGEFRFLKSYADRDGIPMYYARGVSPKNTLYQNAQIIRDEIARVKKETGASKVNLVAFSMGGMNTRAYLETSVYANDVNRAIILGTPQAGVEVWKPILMQQILEKFDEPSAIELSPEYAQMVVNETRAPNPNVPYDLLIGDARKQTGLDFLSDMPASDALISVDSALALDAATVRKHVNADLHDWGPQPVPIDLTGYLYPRDTWERDLRNALRNSDNAPIGSEITTPPPAPSDAPQTDHTPVITKNVSAGSTVTRTVTLDTNASARFVAYYPGGAVDFSLIAPDGKKYEPSDLPRDDGSGVLSLSTDVASFSGYVVKNAPVGDWQLILTRTDSGSDPLAVSTYAELTTSPVQLNIVLGAPLLALGKSNTVSAQLSGFPQTPVPHAKIIASIAQPSKTPNAPFTRIPLALYDDGKHNDSGANDGVYSGEFTPTRAGWHILFVEAQGDSFAREQSSLFAVDHNDGTISGSTTFKQKNNRLQFDGSINVQRAGAYAVTAVLRHIQADGSQAIRQNNFYTLPSGAHPISFTFDAAQIPSGNYVLDLILLDANGAAVELDRASAAVSFSLP